MPFSDKKIETWKAKGETYASGGTFEIIKKDYGKNRYSYGTKNHIYGAKNRTYREMFQKFMEHNFHFYG